MFAQSTCGKGGGGAKHTGTCCGTDATSGCCSSRGGDSTMYCCRRNWPTLSTAWSGRGVRARGGSSGGGVSGCRGGSWRRWRRTYASLNIWFCNGGENSAVTSRGPKSMRRSMGSWNWGQGSMLGSDSNEESRSITGGCSGGVISVSSEEVSDDTTTNGVRSTRGGRTALQGHHGCGSWKNSRMSRSTANLAL